MCCALSQKKCRKNLDSIFFFTNKFAYILKQNIALTFWTVQPFQVLNHNHKAIAFLPLLFIHIIKICFILIAFIFINFFFSCYHISHIHMYILFVVYWSQSIEIMNFLVSRISKNVYWSLKYLGEWNAN